MAKIFWIAKKEGSGMDMWAFNNKRKAQQKAMELAPHFSFGDNGVEHHDDYLEEDYIFYSGTINSKNCFVLYRKNDMPYAKGDFANASEAYGWMEEEGRKVVQGICFPAKLKGGMCQIALWDQSTLVHGEELFKFDKYTPNDPDFDWYAIEDDDDDVDENHKTVLESFKYIPTFESFINR